jgi:hypothetical protein
MLNDFLDKGNQTGTEGFDLGSGEKYACRRAAEKICEVLKKPAPRWWRG